MVAPASGWICSVGTVGHWEDILSSRDRLDCKVDDAEVLRAERLSAVCAILCGFDHGRLRYGEHLGYNRVDLSHSCIRLLDRVIWCKNNVSSV